MDLATRLIALSSHPWVALSNVVQPLLIAIPMGGLKNLKPSLWHNWLACLAVNQKVGGSSPPRDIIVIDLWLGAVAHAYNPSTLGG